MIRICYFGGCIFSYYRFFQLSFVQYVLTSISCNSLKAVPDRLLFKTFLNNNYVKIDIVALGQIKLVFRFSSPPAPTQNAPPHCFLFRFFVVKSVYNVYIDQSKFKSYLPFVLKSRGAIYSTRASTEWEAISEKGS